MEMDFLRRKALQALEERLGYTFSDLSLLDAALTHTSYVKGDGKAHEHNERLEFLGDAVLELCVSEYLYRNFPKLNEGVMTRARAASVCEGALHLVALQLELGLCLRLSRGEEHSGGREKPSILADGVEAVIGAIYLDGGLEAARRFVLSMTETQIRAAVQNVDAKDYKTQLQEYVQKLHKGNVTYELLNTTRPRPSKGILYAGCGGGGSYGHGPGRLQAGSRAGSRPADPGNAGG